MKTRYYLSNIKLGTLFFLLFMLFSCADEDNFSTHKDGNERLSATIVDKASNTRTTLRDNPTNQKVEVKWKAGDAIGVFGSQSGQNVRYQTQEGYISEDGKSTVFETTATAAEGNLTVYYPYQQGATTSPDGALHLTMPQTQLYSLEGTSITQPDATANMMAGKGKDGSIAFRNLFAILRINIAGSDGQVVNKVLFTDLSGKPVSGKFSVTWSGDMPQAEFADTGGGPDLQIELDCGDGVALGSNTLAKFFLIVPARNYRQGFRVEFVLASGEKITKTIGATAGKILLRNMLYPIGDMFPNQDDKVSYTLNDKASVMDDERYDLIDRATLDTNTYKLTLAVADGFAATKDEIIIINNVSTTLPEGYVGTVASVSGSTVVLEPVTDITQVFEELSIGAPIWNSNGTADEAGGYALDLSQYITSIETPDGRPIEYAVDGSTLYMDVPFTRSETDPESYKLSLPSVNFTYKDAPFNKGQLTMGVQMDLEMYFHALIKRWSLKNLECRINPTINFSSNVAINWSGSKTGKKPIFVVNSAPIPAGPVLICPVITFYLVFDVEGKMGVTFDLSFNQEFSFGVSYKNGVSDCYARMAGGHNQGFGYSFSPAVQLEGGLGVGVAPTAGISLWKLVKFDTSLNPKIKGTASLNFDLGSAIFDTFYNSVSGSKVSFDLELNSGGSVYLWKTELFTAETITVGHNLWTGYIVPKLENFAIAIKKDIMAIELDISNKLIFDSEIGLNFYEKDNKTGKFTVEAGSMRLGKYSKPPSGKDVYNIKMEKRTTLPKGEYEARLTVSLDALGQFYDFETDVKTRFVIQDAGIMLTTSKKVGETIELQIDAKPEDRGGVWIDLNNNGKQDSGEEVTKFGEEVNYTIGSQSVSIYGNIKDFDCSGNELTFLDVRSCTTLEILGCYNNILTSLDVSTLTALSTLWCGANKLTSLDVSNCVLLKELNCYDNQIASLNISGCTLLEDINCNRNHLASLDLRGYSSLKSLYCGENQISSLDLTSYTSLKQLSCGGNQLTSLNTTGCTALEYLSCSENQLSSLNTSGNIALEELNCRNNPLISLNTSGCTALKELDLYSNNQLVSLNVSGCTALEELWCYNNQLTSLNASNCESLKELLCGENQLTSLDINGCRALEYLSCSDNQLTVLDVSGLTKLHSLYCNNNNLTTLNVNGCTALQALNCADNGLLGIRPAIFDNIKNLRYDIRYQYRWDDYEKRYVVHKDTERGYWYAHEPEGGCHSPNPCN